MLKVSPDALHAIYEHARRTYPFECCGVVYGPRDRPIADRPQACVNIQDTLHADDPVRHLRSARTAYQMDAGGTADLLNSLDGDVPAKIIYHSHIDVGAYFGEADHAVARFNGGPAYPIEYLVVDVRIDGVRGAKQFAWDAQRQRHVEIAVYDPFTDAE